MRKQNGTVVQLERIDKRITLAGKEKRAVLLAEIADGLRGLPPSVVDDLVERFMQDLRRAKSYWGNGTP